MKLAITCYPTFGGSGAVATELALALAERGHEVHVVSSERPFRLNRWRCNLYFHTVEAGDYPLFRHEQYVLPLTNKLIALVEEHGIEVIHSHYAIPHAQAAWMAREVLREERGIDVRLACTLHGTDITLVGRQHSYFELTRFTIAKQDLLTAPSTFLAHDTEDAFRIPSGRVQVIPNFVDLDRFTINDAEGEVRAQLAPKGERLLVHVSNFRPVKNIPHVISAFAVVAREMPAILALVGEGPELAAAEAQVRDLGLREQVRFIGREEQVQRILQAADLMLLPSQTESFGLAALEAMACGCPVLAYRVGGLPEVIEDGVSGLLCDYGKDICLGSVALRLLQNPQAYQAMRQAARSRAECFARPAIVDAYETALAGLLA
ncbi:MAG: N-acetyl-alpha-D-glucosaminyl L-malate synthase BshA [Planctomycetota bacterium]|nr:MAG: N-acetyl-alpha-D-glucosaminyl L-malate synthase BshA [Planctomycetota bacterium]